MNRRLKWLPVFAALAIVSAGCGDSGTNPEPNKPVAGAETKAPVTPKVQADLDKAKKVDPRAR